jgi:DNA-binding PadR family transcriptional regulator
MAVLSKTEKDVLKKLSENQLMTKIEIRKFLEDNGSSKDASSVVDSVTKKLIDQKLLTAISPVGSTCYIITQRGSQLLRELEV